MLRFVCSSLVFRKSKPGSAESELQDHYRAAGEISHEECKNIPEETKRLYDERRDMRKLPDHCGHPGTTDRKELAKSAGKQYESLLQSLGVPQPTLRGMVEDLGSLVHVFKCSAGEVRQKLVQATRNSGENPGRDTIFVPCDRDLKRRARMDKAAYQYRVWSYFEKSSVYRRLDITIEQATEDRKRAAMDLFERPRIWRKI